MPDDADRAVGPVFGGDRALLNGPRRALLVSRTPRRPVPATPWVRATVAAVRQSAAAGEALVTGLARDPFDLALYECRCAGGAALVALSAPPDESTRRLLRELAPARLLLAWPGGTVRASQREDELWPRDRLIGALADRAWALQVRPGGHMAAVVEALRARGCPVEAWDAPTSEAPSLDAEHNVPRAAESRAAGSACPITAWDCLTHYTREPDGPWPNETRAQHLEWLARGPLDSRREAADALRRILATGVIVASGRLMPGGAKMVSFTARPPAEVPALRRWRKGLRRWDFRPYGVAVRREALAALGARPVAYLSEAELRGLAPETHPFAQRHEPPRCDWSGEAEWRLPGDLKVAALPREAVRILVPTPAEAAALGAEFGYETLPTGAPARLPS